MRLRNMTALYLLRGEQILLLYRVGSRVVPPCWCGIGGHFEPDELNDPRACVLRELKEETGLDQHFLRDLALRYVVMRRKNGELRQNYYFFARWAGGGEPVDCSEGRLEWVDLSRAMAREMPLSAVHCLAHYLETGRKDDRLYAGAVTPRGVQFTAVEEI